MVKEPEWISTGKAARMLGYNPDAFRRKFYEAFRKQHAAFRRKGGHCRWNASVVLAIRGEQNHQPTQSTHIAGHKGFPCPECE